MTTIAKGEIHYPPLIIRETEPRARTVPVPEEKEKRIRIRRQAPQLISLERYCPGATEYDIYDILRKQVNREDIMNHREEFLKKIEIPKMNYPAKPKWKKSPVHAFCAQIIGCLP